MSSQATLYRRSRVGLLALLVLLNGALASCGQEAPELDRSVGNGLSPANFALLSEAATRGTGIDPATYAGEVAIKTPIDLPVGGERVPIVLYLGLNSGSDTRLGINALADLRFLQVRLPDLLTGVIDESCKQKIALVFDRAEATKDRVRAWGTVDVTFYSCNREDPAAHKQGARLFSQRIGVVAEATAELQGECIAFRLLDLDLAPSGAIGAVANALGLTKLAGRIIQEEGATYFTENPVCITLPDELAMLAPRYQSGGPVEVGNGGMGARVSGSVDTSAETLMSLLAIVKDRGLVEERQ